MTNPPSSNPSAGGPQSSPPPATLLDWVAVRFPQSPRKRLKNWFADGRIQLDGKPVYRHHLLCPDPGERLIIVAREASSGRARSNLHLPHRIRIVHIDEHLAILNKPAGILSVPSSDRNGISVLGCLRDYLAAHPGRRPAAEPLPVHRLDEFTSGLLCIALQPEARDQLIAQVRSHQLERTYLAYVDGRLASRSGTWQHACKLDKNGFRQHIVPADTQGATTAITHFEAIHCFRIDRGPKAPPRYISKIRLRLQTGLKHQIRIQAAAAGHPLMGDRTYHPDFAQARSADRDPAARDLPPFHPSRQALHAVRIGLIHPASKAYLSWQANLPADLADYEAGLRA